MLTDNKRSLKGTFFVSLISFFSFLFISLFVFLQELVSSCFIRRGFGLCCRKGTPGPFGGVFQIGMRYTVHGRIVNAWFLQTMTDGDFGRGEAIDDLLSIDRCPVIHSKRGEKERRREGGRSVSSIRLDILFLFNIFCTYSATRNRICASRSLCD